jgi:hypothetical protein
MEHNSLTLSGRYLRLFGPSFLLLAGSLGAAAQTATVHDAEALEMPGEVDSNSPAHWQEGKFYLFNSAGLPVRTDGSNLATLRRATAVGFDHYAHHRRWIESTWVDSNGAIYAWYHTEPFGVCAGKLTAPAIGALVSFNSGKDFEDLGIVLESGHAPDCSAANGYFAGGHGDFSVLLDRDRKYFYFLFTNYAGPVDQQGVVIARMAFGDRAQPVGQVWKYFQGAWEQPGIGGVMTPVFAARAAWASPAYDSYWGPSVHWNTHLKRYVILLNSTCCEADWPQKGIFASFSPSLESPDSWTVPALVLATADWYPQVIGLEPGGSDKEAGAEARLFVGGKSAWTIQFHPN